MLGAPPDCVSPRVKQVTASPHRARERRGEGRFRAFAVLSALAKQGTTYEVQYFGNFPSPT